MVKRGQHLDFTRKAEHVLSIGVKDVVTNGLLDR